MSKIVILLMFVSLMVVVGCGKNQDSKSTSGTKSDSVKVNVKVKTETAKVDDVKVDENDVDGMLDSYEKVATKYLEKSAKLKKGADATLTAELSGLAVKQIDIVSKLEHAKEKMTPKQLEKYTGISVKLESATK